MRCMGISQLQSNSVEWAVGRRYDPPWWVIWVRQLEWWGVTPPGGGQIRDQVFGRHSDCQVKSWQAVIGGETAWASHGRHSGGEGLLSQTQYLDDGQTVVLHLLRFDWNR